MARIFVRERRNAKKGSKRPRFAVVAVEGTDLQVYRPHIRRGELEALAAALGAEIVYLPAGEGSEKYQERPEEHEQESEAEEDEEEGEDDEEDDEQD